MRTLITLAAAISIAFFFAPAPTLAETDPSAAAEASVDPDPSAAAVDPSATAEPAAESKDKSGKGGKKARARKKTVETASGLVITQLKAGKGARPTATSTVKVHYHGTFEDGKVFDSTRKRGRPATFPLKRLIPCWKEGIPMIREGGKSLLVCPPEIAYGKKGKPPRIPANSTLTFEIELVKIVK
jgi:FKBP-type peptidyl-prolyl cis-trans isomerase FkpA